MLKINQSHKKNGVLLAVAFVATIVMPAAHSEAGDDAWIANCNKSDGLAHCKGKAARLVDLSGGSAPLVNAGAAMGRGFASLSTYQSDPNPGMSLNDFLAKEVITALEQGASLEGVVPHNFDVIGTLEDRIGKENGSDRSWLTNKLGGFKMGWMEYDVVRESYLWEAEFLLGARDPGFVKTNQRAGVKAINKALEYDALHWADKYKDNPGKASTAEDSKSIQMKYYLALAKLGGLGGSKDVPAAVVTFDHIAGTAEFKDGKVYVYSGTSRSVFNSLCVLTSIYAAGGDGVEKNIEKADEYAARAANVFVGVNQPGGRFDEGPVWESAKAFVQPHLDAKKK